MRNMPTLGPEPKKSHLGSVVAVAVLAGLAAGAAYWYTHRASPPPPPLPPAPPAAQAEAPAPAPAPPPADPLKEAGLRHLSVRIDGPLETALVAALGKELGEPLTQVVTRSLVWWVSVPGDLRKGDSLELLFQEIPGEEPRVHSVFLQSGKYERSFRAYRFQAAGDPFPRFFLASGEELEQRLLDSPIDPYEQITSLLRDGRRHKGVDFKTPAGTTVRATFDGVISRKNWGFRANGNCLEITESGGKGRQAIYLHLSELPRSTTVGQRVKKGEAIASSGNSGRSFAPHLHYQLMGGGRVLDPFEVHRTEKRKLPPQERARLEQEIQRLESLTPKVAAAQTPPESRRE